LKHRFANFELDSRQRLLYCQGSLVDLAPKAIDLLCVLVENDGRVVSKEEISELVWKDVYIDESNIAKNISLIRKVLRSELNGEDPIQTVPKRGYRFTLAQTIETPASVLSGSASFAVAPASGTSPTAVPLPVGALRGSALLWASGGLGLLIILVAAAVFMVRRHRPRAQGRPSVVVLPFTNLGYSADTAWFATALEETLVSELGTGERLRLIPDDDAERMLRDLKLAAPVNLSVPVLRRIRANLDCDFVVEGAYLRVGDSLRIDTYLQDARSGETISHFTETRPASELLGLISLTGGRLRNALGTGLLPDYQTAAVTASIPVDAEALRLYAEGLQRLRIYDGPAALSLLQRSVEIDASYPLVHAAMAETYSLMGDDKKAAAEAKHAFETSSKLSREERLVVESHFEQATHQWDKAIATQRTLHTLFPDNTNYATQLAQLQLLGGKPADALATITELEHNSAQSDPAVYLTEASIRYQTSEYQAMLGAARHAAQLAEGREAHIVVGRAHTLEGDALVHVGDTTQARAAFEQARAIADTYGDKVGLIHALRRGGGVVRDSDPRASIPIFDEDCKVSMQMGDEREVANCEIAIAFAYDRLGELVEAKQRFIAALDRSQLLGDRRLVLVCLEALTTIETGLAEWNDARQSLTKAQQLADDMKAVPMQTTLLGDEGSLDEAQGRIPQAQVKLEEALRRARAGKDPVAIATELQLMADLSRSQNDFKQAREFLNEECSLWQKTGHDLALAKCQVASAEVDFDRHDTAGALSLLTAAKFDAAAIDPTVTVMNLRARISLSQGNIAAARSAQENAETLLKTSPGLTRLTLENEIVQACISAASGNTKEAETRLLKVRREAVKNRLTGPERLANLTLMQMHSSAS